jgi:ADP-L-glycero-D-manno-heptose 6-epimerase
MHILVTGHKGFIGQNIVKVLSKEHKVVGYEWGDAAYSLDNIDRVIHLGAISSTTCTDEKALKIQNYDFTVRLVSSCVDKNIPIQIASSASVYGINNKTFKESDPVDPQNLYAKSKADIEKFCLDIKSSTPIQLFRYFNVYGPHEDHKKEQASPYHKFKKQAEELGYIELFKGSMGFCRDFVPVQNVIETHISFFNIKESGIWNVGTGQPKSFYEVAVNICKEIKWVPMPDNLKGSYQRYTCADLTKLNLTLLKEAA